MVVVVIFNMFDFVGIVPSGAALAHDVRAGLGFNYRFGLSLVATEVIEQHRPKRSHLLCGAFARDCPETSRSDRLL